MRRLADVVAPFGRVAVVYPGELPILADWVSAELTDPVLIPVPSGEAAKTSEVLAACWGALAEHGFTRDDCIVGVGGGTTTDLAGFVAATWLRGVAYVAVPTTVLAMVDAAVGGKTGINLPAGKNLVGAFYEPAAVICDFAVLATLSDAEIRSGMAEVVKCGFIADPRILDLVTRPDRLDPGSSTFAELVGRAVRVKADVVAGDFREATSIGNRVGREALNYGHTLGHAIEAHSGFTWRHGEAISVGMAWIGRVSRAALGLDDDVVTLHTELLAGIGLPAQYDGSFVDLRRIMSLDKKARGAKLRLVGLGELAEPVMIVDPPECLMEACYDELGRGA
ncbi:3-dehydroquinate synthase [Tessaracoccus sp. OH4464_COT-324]|nr:3-dehydroquinate synthase [Tessaracoccus sp. OH4464_COT-324]